MSVRTYAPNPALACRVATITVVETAAGEVPVLPLAGAVMGVQYRGRIVAEQGPLSQAGVTGIQSTVRRFVHSEPTGSVLVRFTAQGVACLGVPATELCEQSVSLDQLLGRTRSAELCERLCEVGDERARVRVVEQFLMQLPFASDVLVARAAAMLAARECLSVGRVATQLAVSERQLERRFRARVGISPKQFARLARFERAQALVHSGADPGAGRVVELGSSHPCDAASKPQPASLASIAQRAGYCDQSHLAREVRQFSGLTPGELFAR